MERKPRLTLDNAGLRLRPRTYADSHVPKRVAPRVVNDIALPVRNTVENTKAISTAEFAHVAKTLFAEPVHIERKDPSVQPQQKHNEEPISELVEAIQRKHSMSTKPRAFYETEKQSVKEAEPYIPVVKQRSITARLRAISTTWSHRSVMASAMAVLLMIGGLVALFSSIHSNKIVTMQVQALSEKSEKASDAASGQASSTDVPSEDAVPDSVKYSYSVAADMPKYVSIPKIKISKTRILRMGIGDDGAIKTPRNVWDTGWYEGSSNPGDKNGAALIVGHVSGPTNGGIFYNLYRLTDGDEINVTMGDDKVYTYQVVSKEEVPADNMNMNNYLVSKNVDKPGLTLITCAGEFNPSTQTFDHRLAVFAIRTN